MKPSIFLLGPSILLLSLASCSVKVTDFCEGWASDACGALADCCEGGGTFMEEDCPRILYTSCVTRIPYDHVSDRGAARACLGTIGACSQPPVDATGSIDLRLQCSSVASGEVPAGSPCFVDADCAPSGDYAICWHGPGGTRADGRCTSVFIDKTTCSFNGLTDTLRLCSETTFCTLPGLQIAGPAPDDEADFDMPCQARPATGEDCIDPGSDEGLLPCQPGLYCHIVGSSEALCEPLRAEGEACDGNFGWKECEDDLVCERAGDSPDRTCQRMTHGGPFCIEPPVCGDGACADDEASSCPEDCGFCGDGVCGSGEGGLNCAADCGAPLPSCRTCACALPLAEGGCADVCDAALSGASSPNLCNGVPALPQCASCISHVCLGDPANCGG